MKKYTVYCHTLKCDGRKYVGITSQKPKKRWNYGNGYTSYFKNAINKYGWKNFKHTILYENLTEQEAIKKEIELIDKWELTNRKKGFNICKGGQGTNGYKFTDKDREKMSKSHLGIKLSEEQKEKISIALKEHYRKIPKKMKTKKEKVIRKGFHLSDETKEKLRQCNLGKKQSKETIEKRMQKLYISVDMLSLDGEYIKTFPSITDASNFINGRVSHIVEVCKGKRKTANNYKWRYSNESIR